MGKPSYGTTVWDLLFEAQIPETQARIQEEIQRVVGTDPRLYLNGVNVYPQDNGVLIEVLVTFVSSTEPERLLVFFNPSSRQASYV